MQNYKNRLIRFVCYADPPAPATASISDCNRAFIEPKLIATPNSWSKSALRLVKKAIITDSVYDQKNRGKIIASSWNRVGGILIAVEMPFKYILNKYADLCCASLCCCSKHHTRVYPFKHNTLQLVDAVPFCFITQDDGGCNPAAYNFFPQTHKFNNYVNKVMLKKFDDWCWDSLENKKCKEKKSLYVNRPKITEKLVKYHFPDIDFSNNVLLDMALDFKNIY